MSEIDKRKAPIAKEWKDREERLRRRTTIFYIIATIGAIIAAVGFILEIFGLLREAGLALGILGILITVIFGIWGTKAIFEVVVGSGERIKEELSFVIKEEGQRVVSEVKDQSERIMNEVRKGKG